MKKINKNLILISMMLFVVMICGAMNAENTGKVNINTATGEELSSLDGIGTQLAQRIIEYREKNGDFKTIEDIMKVKGIGEKVFEKNKNRITI